MSSSVNEWSVRQLIGRCARRPADAAAWQEFVRRFHPAIRASVSSVLARLSENENRAKAGPVESVIDELVEGVYRSLIEKGSASLERVRCSGDDSMKSYLLLVSINVVRDHLRDGVRQQAARSKSPGPRFGPAFGLAPTSVRQ